MGRLIFHINSAYAEFEREIIRDRVIAGIKAKREKTGAWAAERSEGNCRRKLRIWS
jgi:DNA invertase Pin-like site-specific DNA recombinase